MIHEGGGVSQATTASVEGASATSWRATFHGRGFSLFGIFVTNLVLMLVTLGVYVFWAKVRTRRFLFSETDVAGDRFAFHGRGAELLLGMLKAAVIFGVPMALLRTAPALLGASHIVTITCSTLASVVAALFMPVAMVGARRYRLTRTSWRGIRFGFHGGVGAFMRIFLGGWTLTLLTLGIYYPVYLTRSHGFMVRHSSFGTAPFEFDGDGKPLVLDFLYTLLLTVPTLGLVWFWFLARKRRYLWEHTSFRGVRFRSTITGGRLLALVAGNVALLLITLGLAWPWTIVRSARFHCANLSLDGAVDLAGIEQTRAVGLATGEGLLGLLDIDMGFV
jgi:uncharacterized membrane protein YjgN (DUF898 family)